MEEQYLGPLLCTFAACGNVKKLIRLCIDEDAKIAVNHVSPTQTTPLFNLFKFWGQKADVKNYECILKYLCRQYNLRDSWGTISSHEDTKGKSPLDLIIEKNIVISP